MDKKDLPIIENSTWIPLTQGEWALVDTEVALIAPKFCLQRYKNTDLLYGTRRVKIDDKWASRYLHRFVFEYYELGTPLEIDHINGNGLDNRRDNLRPATSKQNKGNVGLIKSNTSGYRGVSWNKRREKWIAFIKIDYNNINLGSFDCCVAAARAYDRASIKHFGIEFASTNFPKSDYI